MYIYYENFYRNFILLKLLFLQNIAPSCLSYKGLKFQAILNQSPRNFN